VWWIVITSYTISFNPLIHSMNRIVKQLVFSVVLGAFVISHQASSGENKAAAIRPEPPAKEHPGKAVYTKYCMVCHQAGGSGVPGMFPPLSKGSWVGKDPKELVLIITKGLSGKVEVNGEVYKSAMPAQAQLTDKEIADVLSYIRSDFGNSFKPVDIELVKKVRSGK